MMRSLTPAPCGPLLPFTLTHPALSRWFALLSPYCPNKRRPRSRSDAHARIGCSFSTVIRLDSQTTLLPPAPPTGLLLICGAFRSLTLLRSFKRRHAWLNLRGKRTTTGRINQVASLSLSLFRSLHCLLVLLLLFLLLLCVDHHTTRVDHGPSHTRTRNSNSTPTNSLRLAIHSHTLSHCHSIIRIVATEFLHLLLPLSSCARSAAAAAAVVAAAGVAAVAAFTATSLSHHTAQRTRSQPHHIARAQTTQTITPFTLHSPLLTVLCDLSARSASLSACLCLTATHTATPRAPTSPTLRLALGSQPHTHTLDHTLLSKSVCVSRALSSLFALFSLLPGHTDRLERRAHTHHPCVARGAASVTRSSLFSRSLSMNRSRSWLSSVRNLALSRSARLAARNHAHTAQTGVRNPSEHAAWLWINRRRQCGPF